MKLNNRCSLQVRKGGNPINYLKTFLPHMCQCKVTICKNVQQTKFIFMHLRCKEVDRLTQHGLALNVDVGFGILNDYLLFVALEL
jgi:hypothetical protein